MGYFMGVYKYNPGIWSSHFYPRDFQSWVHEFLKLLVAPVIIYLQWWIKTLQQPNQLLYSKDRFLQCFSLLVFIFTTVLCYKNTTQHIQHSTFNHSGAWDNLERKLNINFYFRAKEIKSQESDLPMMNYRHLESTQVFQLQQCPVYKIISMLKRFLKV